MYELVRAAIILVCTITVTGGSQAPEMCQNRCFDRYNPSLPCQCNNLCGKFGNCCPDFQSACLQGSCSGECSLTKPSNSCQCNSECVSLKMCCKDYFAECTKRGSCSGLCGMKFNLNRTCQCHDKCKRDGNCCSDYVESCKSDYTCNGKCDVEKKWCSCLESCESERTCCTDYAQSCKGDTAWKSDGCARKEDMICPKGFETPPLILFGIDGLRNDYIYRNITPNLLKLASCGVHTPYLRSAYPSSTFPNFYTIATGLYPEAHGVIDNSFYDHDFNEEFSYGNFNPSWWGGEPIWVTAMNQGYKAACYFWVGSDVNITRFPDYYNIYNGRVPNEKRIQQVLKWLDLPAEKRPTIITAYMSSVDSVGHAVGPTGPVIDAAIADADTMVGMLMDGLKSRKLDTCVNVVIVSDHGMAEVNCSNANYVDDYGVDPSEHYVDLSTHGRIGKSTNKSLHGLFDAVEVSDKLACRVEETHFQAYVKQRYLPKRLHYAKSGRIDDVHLLLDKDWVVRGKRSDPRRCLAGLHGWDPQYEKMHGTFLAHGPSLKRGYNMSGGFENIEIYNLLCDLLDITPAPNNGTQGSVADLLVNTRIITGHTDNFATPMTCQFDLSSSMTAQNYSCSPCQSDDNPQALNYTQAISKEKKWDIGYGEIMQQQTETLEFCHLSHFEYFNVYDLQKKMPYLVFFTLGEKEQISKSGSSCRKPDYRVQPKESLTCYGLENLPSSIASIFLHPNGFTASDGDQLLTNMLPVYSYFVPVWQRVGDILRQWSKRFKNIAVYVGPIFDYDYDGLVDSENVLRSKGKFVVDSDASSLPIPTHVFVIVLKCKKDVEIINNCGSNPRSYEVLSLILPNYSEEPCYQEDKEQWITYVLSRNLARVRDVELLTGISFFPAWSKEEDMTSVDMWMDAIKLKLRLPDPESNWIKIISKSEFKSYDAEATDTVLLAGVVVALVSLFAFAVKLLASRLGT